ncbi:hypothetical protein QBC34DRAFT_425395 [Podospora aff. communis PSN243]|uniref:HNH nuclease domain-containing protein n=1 Tax=Podospora aff. communis PSN243 TaxID=3040156 RepID=A0AAV9GMC5_9PEZI|nr:hypothetical protein QBC34DRAFT_425395 [Podospora aff. communis PSN243]
MASDANFAYGPCPLEMLPEIPLCPTNGAGLSAILDQYQAHQTGQGNDGDDTAKVLRAFLNILKGPGHTQLCCEIHTAILRPYSVVWASGQLMPPIGHVLTRCRICGEDSDVGCECKEGAYAGPLDPRKPSGMFVLRNQILVRDKYNCIATGRPSLNFPEPFTRITHILPLALDPFQPPKNDRHRKNKAIIWAALRRYFPFLNGRFAPASFGMIGPHNTFLLGAELSDLFMMFRYFVTPTKEKHVYDNMFMALDQASLDELGTRGIPQVSRFGRDSLSGTIPPPDPLLLLFHAKITQILHSSGQWAGLVSSEPAMEYESGASVLEARLLNQQIA